jgi:tetratricopeptide (TPR) repeat protein
MPIKKLFLPALFFPLLFCSCRLADRRFERAYADTLAQSRGETLLTALLELDQEYPGQLKLKVTLGGMLLAAGDLTQARIILEKGEKLARHCRDEELRALLYTNLAELCYRRGEYSRGADCAGQALQAAPDQNHGVIFTRAKCLCALGRYREALDCFRQAGAEEPMTAEDMEIYAALLINHGKVRQAIDLLRERERSYGYALGLGLQQSAGYEQLGLYGEAVMAAAKDMEYRRSLGLAVDTELLARLEDLSDLLTGELSDPGGRGQAAARAFAAFVRGRWPQCIAALKPLELQNPSPFYDYLLLASLLEAGSADAGSLAAYRNMEPTFRLLPAYYYHLWRGLKAGAGDYTIFSARPVLEKCIHLAPRTRYARESRAQLGLLLGMSALEGEKLLLGAELDDILARLAGGAEPDILEPALEMLPLPDNIYRSAALLILRQALVFPAVKEYLARRPPILTLLAPD